MSTLIHSQSHRPDTTELALQQTTVASGPDSNSRVIRRVSPVPSIWEWFGLSRRRFTHYLPKRTKSLNSGSGFNDEDKLFETEEYLWKLPMLDWVLHCVRQYSHGTIASTLTVYPVVPEFDQNIEDIFNEGSISEVQRLLNSGSLHPFTRDQDGASLLHVGNLCQGPD